MIDENDISESVVSMNTVLSGGPGGMGLLERLRQVNQLVQQDNGQGTGARIVHKINDTTQHLTLAERLTIGRSHTCTLKIDDPKLSREHLEIVKEETAFTIRDLDSKNGISINNEPTLQKILTPGDVITAGQNTFVYLED